MNNNDLEIMGSGTISSGTYRGIDIAGRAKINGDVVAEKIEAAGSLSSAGNIQAKRISTAGSFKTNGSIICDNISVAGSATIKGDLEAKLISFAGSADVYKNITSEKLKVSGSLKADGDINCKDIELKVSGANIVNIKGEDIFIGEKKRKLLFKRKGKVNNIDFIEGKNINIDNCNVKRIKGANVIIGDYCTVDYVEYTNTLEISKKAKVKESKQSW